MAAGTNATARKLRLPVGCAELIPNAFEAVAVEEIRPSSLERTAC